jgi:hypothetical protein
LIIPMMMALKKEVHKYERIGCIVIAIAIIGFTIDS